jgi:type I restriction enzyme S subunit
MDTKKLRQKILDLAIHGKLVPQDPNDEPASVLLERIRKEKEQLIKEGKIKSPKKSKSAGDTSHYPKEGPWELPRGWAWCHLSDLASFAGGKTPSMDNKDFWKNGKHLWITSKDMKSRSLIDSQMKISDTAVREMTVFHPGTILMVNRSGILRRTLPLAILNAEAAINQDIKAIVPYLLCLSPYLYYAILSQEAFILSEYKKAGTTVDNINFDKFISLLIPLPPQKEQDRIVSSINQCFAIIENIDSSQKDLNISLDAAKAKILDLAIRGKLVPQDPNEEPAIELLMRINPDFRPSDNLHYEGDLPNGWCFSTIGDLFQHNTGKALNGREREGENLRYITTSNLYWDRFDLTEVRTMPFTEVEKEKCRATKGDLLVCEGGDIGRAAVWPYDYDVMIQNHIHRLRPKDELSVRFFYYIFLLYKQKGFIGGKGIAILGLSSRELDKMVVPVPPVSEQHRIVSVIDTLFSQLESLANNLS